MLYNGAKWLPTVAQLGLVKFLSGSFQGFVLMLSRGVSSGLLIVHLDLFKSTVYLYPDICVTALSQRLLLKVLN